MPEQSCKSMQMADLEDIRQEIDLIDENLLNLLNQRASLSKQVGRIKADTSASIFNPEREQSLLERLAELNAGDLPLEHMRSIWREILSSSRALQQPQNVAYLGPEGTFSYFAAREYIGRAAKFQPCRDITQIFEQVSANVCNLGVVPLENSLQGTVGISVDLFLKYDVCIKAELYSRISHALLGRDKAFADIKKVYSHPQPLAQCGDWLRANLPYAELIPVASTAHAAQTAAREQHAAALGNANLSKIYDLPIMANQVEDNKNNWTRFVVISKPDPEEKLQKGRGGINKTSAIFTIPDKPGSLARVLDIMGQSGLNMRKIESRPMAGHPWHYVFFVDLENNLENPVHGEALKEIKQNCHSFRILGNYPQGSKLEQTVDTTSEEKGE